MSAHTAIHGFLVALITGMPWLGLAEWLLHSVFDFSKCRGRFGLGLNQTLHLLCKLLWALLAARLLALPLI